MRARVYDSAEREVLASALTVLSVAVFAAIFSRAIDFGMHDKLSLAIVVAIGCVAPSLTWRSRGSLRAVEPGTGTLRIGGRVIDATKITGFGAVEGAHGWSVAVSAGHRTTVLEVARRADAERIATSVRRKWPRDGVVTFEVPSRRMRQMQSVLSFAGVACAALYWVCATAMIDLEFGKPLFGVSMLAIAGIGVVLYFLRVVPSGWLAVGPGVAQLFTQNVTAVVPAAKRRRSAERVTIVTHASNSKRRDGELVGEGVGAHAIAHLRDARRSRLRVDPGADPQSTKLLPDSSESVQEWLARLDAWSREAKAAGYRGNLPARDDLWAVLRNGAAPIEARLAAGRLLRARYGDAADEIVKGVSDRAVRQRVRVAVDDSPDEAAEQLERLGPVFAARHRQND